MKKTDTNKDYFNSAEVKKILDLSEMQLYIYRQKGIIKGHQYLPRGRHRYDKEAILKLRDGK